MMMTMTLTDDSLTSYCLSLQRYFITASAAEF